MHITPDPGRCIPLTLELVDRSPLALGWPPAPALSEDPCRPGNLLFGGLVQVHRPGERPGDRLFRQSLDHYPAVVRTLKELDDIAFAYRGGGLRPLPVDLDVPAPAGLGGVPSMFDQADQLEPRVDSMSLIHMEL